MSPKDVDNICFYGAQQLLAQETAISCSIVVWDKEDASVDRQRRSGRKQGGFWMDHSQRKMVQYLGCDCHVELSD